MLHNHTPPVRGEVGQPDRRSLQRATRKYPVGEMTAPVPHGRESEAISEDEPLPLWVMKITQPVFLQLLNFLLSREPEAAGLLLGPTNDDLLVTHFEPDLTGRGTPASFQLGTTELNAVLQQLKPAGINCKGIVHSHPPGFVSPSQGDLNYLRRLFGLSANATAAQFYMPIVCGGRLYPYVYAQGRVWCADLVLI